MILFLYVKRLQNDLHFYVTYLYLFQMKAITLLLVSYMLVSAGNAEDTVSFCILHTSNSEPSNAACISIIYTVLYKV